MERAPRSGEEVAGMAQTHRATVKRVGLTLAYVSAVLLCVASMLLFALERWLFNTWAALSVDEIIYHLSVSLEGAETSTVHAFVTDYLPFVLLGCGVLLGMLYAGHKRGGHAQIASLLGVLALSGVLVGTALADASKQVDLSSYLDDSAAAGDESEDFIGSKYQDPSELDLQFPERKRNLIYLFLESMETTYANEESGGAFSHNLIPGLVQLAQQNEDFSGASELLNGGIVYPGTDWTMGGMFAQTSGTPLKLPMAGEQLSGLDELFPAMVTLGDILAREGYHQELLLGSDATFGGRAAYFTPHGSYQIYDHPWAQKNGFIPEDYNVFWGFEDTKLFDLLKERLTELAKAEEPFNVTALTVDTHFEDGYVCQLCKNRFKTNQYANVMLCSSRQVSRFVEWVQEQDFYENTTIVICGDHVTMDSDFCNHVPSSYQRRTYTAVVNAPVTPSDPTRTRTYATFDMFPTTLAALGVQIPGDRLGLGTNLFSERDTLAEEYGVEELDHRLRRKSEFLTTFSELAIDEDYMARAARDSKLYPRTLDEGKLRFYLSDSGYFRYDAINRAYLRIADARTGKVTCINMKVLQKSPNDPNRFVCYANSSYTNDDLPYLKVEAFMSVGDIADYRLDTYQQDA